MPEQSVFQKILNFQLTKIIISIIVMLGVIMLCNYGGAAILQKTGISHEAVNAIIGIITAGLVLISYVLLFRYYEKRQITELSFKRFAQNALIGFFTGLVLQSLVIWVIYLAGDYTVISVNPVSALIPAFVIGVTAGVYEEIIIRGIIFRLTEEKLGTMIALVISAALFGLAHLGNKGATLYSALSVALQAGVLLAAAYAWSRNLWLPIFLHFAWDFAEGGIYGVLVSGGSAEKSLITSHISGNSWITGGSFGPENSIQANVFCLIAGLIFLWLAKGKGNFIKPYWKTRLKQQPVFS